MKTELTIIAWLSAALLIIVILWLWQLFENRNLKAFNDYIMRDAKQYRSLHNIAVKDLKTLEIENQHLKEVISMQDVLIDELNAQNIVVVDPQTVEK